MHKRVHKAVEIGLHLAAAAVWVLVLTQGRPGYDALGTFDPGLASGKWAVRFLLVSLSMTPLRTYLRWNQAIRFRKPAGLWSFGFAVLHVYFYFQDARFDLRSLLSTPFLALGLLGLLILTALAVTSNRWSMKRLAKNWKRLHRLVYLAGGAVVTHALLAVNASKKMYIRDPEAIHELRVNLALLAVLLLVRVPVVQQVLTRSRRPKSFKPALYRPIKNLEAGILEEAGLGRVNGVGSQPGVGKPAGAKKPVAESQSVERLRS